jgi:ribosomal protein S1
MTSSTPDPRPASGGSNLDAKLEAEINDALGGMSIDQLLDLPDSSRAKPASRGVIHREFRRGIVVGVRGEDVMVEFGPKSAGVCPLLQFDEPPPVGTHLEFVVERHDAKEGLLILSREGAVQKATWEALTVGQVVEATCTGMNKGGLEFEVAQHKAFMPAGQVDVRHIKDISIFLGQKLPCEIVQLDRQRGRIVLSRKAVLEQERARNAEKILADLEPNQERDAVITTVQPYGAFADLGGIDGLIHVSDLAWERVRHPGDLVQEGQQVRVRVLRVDRTQNPPKISLGLKQITADPSFEKFGELAVGSTVTGKVTKVMDFGAFVEIAPGVEGLVHISEISHERIPTVEAALKKDQTVTAKVLRIDADQRRVSLSIKALVDRPAMPDQPGRPGRPGRPAEELRVDDPSMRKLRAKFGAAGGLKGGIA